MKAGRWGTEDEARNWQSSVIETEDGKKLSISLNGEKGSVAVRLRPKEAIDLARWLFSNAVRLSAHSQTGRLSAALAAQMMVREVQEVRREAKGENAFE